MPLLKFQIIISTLVPPLFLEFLIISGPVTLPKMGPIAGASL